MDHELDRAVPLEVELFQLLSSMFELPISYVLFTILGYHSSKSRITALGAMAVRNIFVECKYVLKLH